MTSTIYQKINVKKKNKQTTGCFWPQNIQQTDKCTSLDKESKNIKNTAASVRIQNESGTIMNTVRTHIHWDFFFFCWSWSKTDWQVQQRDTFRETHSEIWINTEYIQSELDKHSFHAVQWKHLKHDWSVPWFFVSAFASFSPFLSYLQTFNVIEASIVQGRFLTWGALTWWHRMQVTFFVSVPPLLRK